VTDISASPAASAAPSKAPAYTLTLSCPDQAGIVHAVSGGLVAARGNITESQQYGSPETGTFFMRVDFTAPGYHAEVRETLAPVAQAFGMEWQLHAAGAPVRTLIMASKSGHCLNDLLFRQRAGTLPIEIPAIVSNHQDLAGQNGDVVERDAVEGGKPGGKEAAEAQLRGLMQDLDIELVVLARYMQILSNQLCRDLSGRAINIHHSFLPSFKGAKPYHQAHARGVKLIGATAHYVTSDLDEGPIIEQEVIRVDHARSASQLVALGSDVEGRTLSKAVQWHAEHRVLLDGKRTIVFN
jgi:formyltetrahydrofolate deformylase